MPAKRKAKPAPDVWVIKSDGRRVGTAETEAKAKAFVRELEKTLPTYINFDISVERSQSAQPTTV